MVLLSFEAFRFGLAERFVTAATRLPHCFHLCGDVSHAAAKALERESAKLAVVAQSGGMADIAAQVKALGKSCGGCHKPFRKPKAERFKR